MERPFPAYKGDEPYIFVSYSHQDADIVFPGIQRLRDQGFNIWYDEGINPGASWREELAESILGCDLFIILVSPQSADSDNCLKEVNYALEHDRALLAIHQETTQLSPGLELALSDRQAIFRHELTEEQYRDKVLSGVRRHIQRSQSFAPTVPAVIASKSSWPMLISAGLIALAILAVGFLYMKPSEVPQTIEELGQLQTMAPLEPSVAVFPVFNGFEIRVSTSGMTRGSVLEQAGEKN